MRQIISIPDKESAIIRHIKAQSDISKYIRNLVQSDMSQRAPENFTDKVKGIVYEILNDKNITVKNTSRIDDSINESIMSILG